MVAKKPEKKEDKKKEVEKKKETKEFEQYELKTGRTVMSEREVYINGVKLIELSLSDRTTELHSEEELKKLK